MVVFFDTSQFSDLFDEMVQTIANSFFCALSCSCIGSIHFNPLFLAAAGSTFMVLECWLMFSL